MDKTTWILDTDCDICQRLLQGGDFDFQETEEELTRRMALTMAPCVLIMESEK